MGNKVIIAGKTDKSDRSIGSSQINDYVNPKIDTLISSERRTPTRYNDRNDAVAIRGMLFGRNDRFIDEHRPYKVVLTPGIYLDIPSEIAFANDITTIVKYLAALMNFSQEKLDEIPNVNTRSLISTKWNRIWSAERHTITTTYFGFDDKKYKATEKACKIIISMAQDVQNLFYEQLKVTYYETIMQQYLEAHKLLVANTIALARINKEMVGRREFIENYDKYRIQTEIQAGASTIMSVISFLSLSLSGIGGLVVAIASGVANALIDTSLGEEQAKKDYMIQLTKGDQISIGSAALQCVEMSKKGKLTATYMGYVGAGTGTFESFIDYADEHDYLMDRYMKESAKLDEMETKKKVLLTNQIQYIEKMDRLIQMLQELVFVFPAP